MQETTDLFLSGKAETDVHAPTMAGIAPSPSHETRGKTPYGAASGDTSEGRRHRLHAEPAGTPPPPPC